MRPRREKKSLSAVEMLDIQWAPDFMHDAPYCDKRFRTLNIIDEGTRECLAIEVDTDSVIRLLERLKKERRLPQQIRADTRKFTE